jgi:hypothetical protein
MAPEILTKFLKSINFSGVDNMRLYLLAAAAAIGHGGNSAYGSAHSSQASPHHFPAPFSPANLHFQGLPGADQPMNIPSHDPKGFFSPPNLQAPFSPANLHFQGRPGADQPMNISFPNPQGPSSMPNFQAPFSPANLHFQGPPGADQPMNIHSPNPKEFFSQPNLQASFPPANPHFQGLPGAYSQWPQHAFQRENDSEEHTTESIYKNIPLDSLEE